MCKFAGLRITQHVKNVHGIDKDEYARTYGLTITTSTREKQRAAFRKAGDWIERKKAAGVDLTGYKERMSDAVRDAILSDPEERARRSQLLGQLNKRADARKRSSETAKRTSARPEIQVARAKKLADWRAREPERFYDTCVASMHSFKTSKPEKRTLIWLQETFPEFGFKGNQRLMSREYFHLTKSQKRQIDIMSKSHKVIVEIDGYLHFNNVEQWDNLPMIQAKDAELNAAGPRLGYTVIRVSLDRWNKVGELDEPCKGLVISLLSGQNLEPGLHQIGEAYCVKH